MQVSPSNDLRGFGKHSFDFHFLNRVCRQFGLNHLADQKVLLVGHREHGCPFGAQLLCHRLAQINHGHGAVVAQVVAIDGVEVFGAVHVAGRIVAVEQFNQGQGTGVCQGLALGNGAVEIEFRNRFSRLERMLLNVLAQGRVHTGLPALAGRFEGLQQIGIQADGSEHLGGVGFGSAARSFYGHQS